MNLRWRVGIGICLVLLLVMLIVMVHQTSPPAKEPEPIVVKPLAMSTRLTGSHPLPPRPLKSEVAVAKSPVASPPAPPPESPARPTMRKLVATNQVALAQGETMVIGGWATSPGKHTWIFVTPEVAPGDGQSVQVTLKTLSVEVPERFVNEPDWQQFKTDKDQSSATGVLASGGLEELIDSIKDAPDLNALSAPTVTTADGNEATIEIGQELLTPSGATEFQGFRFRIMAGVDAATGAMSLTTTTEITLPSP